MVHQHEMVTESGTYIGDLYFNNDCESYTAIMQPSGTETLMEEWWVDNLFGDPEVVGVAEREDRKCFLIHVK